MGLNTIHRTSLPYRILYFFARFFFGLYYRRFIIVGRENIPKDVQIIFASNHQNALMDALSILFGYGKPVVFLARADMFKKQFFARLLYFVKILPVFRPRDGMDSMSQNYETFSRTAKVLKAGLPIGILPEGTHSPIKKLQPLKKGICRIAFLTAETEEFKSEIMIVPMGVDYTHYSRAGTDLLLQYGKPIPVSEYYSLYQENPQKAITQLRDRLSLAIHNLMIDARNEEFYQTYLRLSSMLPQPQAPHLHEARVASFYQTQSLINKLDEQLPENKEWMEQLSSQTSAYFKKLRLLGLRDRLLQQKPPSLLTLILNTLLSLIAMVVHIPGMLFNYIPYKLPVLLAAKVRDKQFVATLHYGFGLVLFFFWYLIAAIVILLISGSLMSTLLVLVIAALSGIFSFYHYSRIKALVGSYRLWNLKRKNNQLKDLLEKRSQIMSALKEKQIIS